MNMEIRYNKFIQRVDRAEQSQQGRIRAAASWHFWAHISVTCASLSTVYRGRLLYVLTTALNCTKHNFFPEYFSGFAWFPTLDRPNLTALELKGRISDIKFLDIIFFFWSTHHLTKLWHGDFPHSIYTVMAQQKTWKINLTVTTITIREFSWI